MAISEPILSITHSPVLPSCVLLNRTQLGGSIHTRYQKRHRDTPCSAHLALLGLSRASPRPTQRATSTVSLFLIEQRENPGARSKGTAGPSGGQRVGRPKAGGIGEHPGGPAEEAQVGTRVTVYICVYICVCMHDVCACVYLGSSEASFPNISRKRKESPPLQRHAALPTPPAHIKNWSEGENVR